MYVACPSCRSLFQIQPVHLRAAHGAVRCGVCQHTFNASGAVFDDPQQALDQSAQDVVREIDDLVDRALDQVPSAGAFAGAATGDSDPVSSAETWQPEPPPADVATPEEEERAPEDARDDRPRPGEVYRFHADTDFYAQPARAEYFSLQQMDSAAEATLLPAGLFAEPPPGVIQTTNWTLIGSALLLTLLLLVQYAFVERHRLALSAHLRPALEVLCTVLRCDLPLRRDISRVEMIEREVTDHPNVDDALLINAIFVNRATFRQAYPLFQISFSDVSGAVVALRRFLPREYLDPERDPSAGMAPDERVHLMLEVIDPGETAVSFQFDFL